MRRLLIAAVSVVVLVLAGCSSSGTGDPAALLSDHGLAGKTAEQIIDQLDRLGADERPADLMASVRPDQLLLSGGKREAAMKMPADRFYLSVAPYVSSTHECFYHSLTTCKGELAGEDIKVTIVDNATGRVLVDQEMTTFQNGFVGFWLPRDLDGTIQVSHEGKTGSVDFATRQDSPTCLTTLQLS